MRERESLTPGTKWKTVKLKDIVKITSGKFVKKDEQNDDAKYPVYNGGISNTGYYNEFNVEGPKVIISARGASAGFVNLIQGNFWAGNSCYVLNILNDIDINFLYYLMKSNQDKLQEQQVSGAIPAVNMNQVYDLEIKIPESLEEQKRIAQVLSDLDDLSSLHGKKVDQLTKMKDQLMSNKTGIIEKERLASENNGWSELKLSEIFDTRNGYTPSKSVSEYWEDGDIPWFRIEDIRENGHILSDSIQHINRLGVKSSGLFPANSFILSTSATIGEHAWIKVESLSNQRFICFTLKESMKEKFDLNYLHWYFFVIGAWCKENAIQGSTFPTVDVSLLKEQTIEFPNSVEEQKKIAQLLSDYDTMTSKQDKLSNIIQRERESLQRKLLT